MQPQLALRMDDLMNALRRSAQQDQRTIRRLIRERGDAKVAANVLRDRVRQLEQEVDGMRREMRAARLDDMTDFPPLSPDDFSPN